MLNIKGFEVVPHVLPDEMVDELIVATSSVRPSHSVRQRSSIYAIRNLFDVLPQLVPLVKSPPIASLMTTHLGSTACAVRAIYFDKPDDANWSVPWHQDLSIAVAEQVQHPEFGPWSTKAGVPHTQPPAHILARMLTLRIHLDACDESNGALRVIPGSHTAGRLGTSEVRRWVEHVPEVSCCVPRGGALLMRPLLLHASSAAASNSHRRVIHLEFSPDRLPDPLQWDTAVPVN